MTHEELEQEYRDRCREIRHRFDAQMWGCLGSVVSFAVVVIAAAILTTLDDEPLKITLGRLTVAVSLLVGMAGSIGTAIWFWRRASMIATEFNAAHADMRRKLSQLVRVPTLKTSEEGKKRP